MIMRFRMLIGNAAHDNLPKRDLALGCERCSVSELSLFTAENGSETGLSFTISADSIALDLLDGC